MTLVWSITLIASLKGNMDHFDKANEDSNANYICLVHPVDFKNRSPKNKYLKGRWLKAMRVSFIHIKLWVFCVRIVFLNQLAARPIFHLCYKRLKYTVQLSKVIELYIHTVIKDSPRVCSFPWVYSSLNDQTVDQLNTTFR